MEYLIKEEAWEHILCFLRTIKGLHTKNEERARLFVEGVFFILRSGSQWRLLPFYYGHWRAVHRKFKQWSDKNIWKDLFLDSQKDPDLEYVMIDGPIVRAHACAAGYKKNSAEQEALGRSKGGFSTKIHALTDALGNPLKCIVTPGQRQEITQANARIQDVFDSGVLGDKGYDANVLITQISEPRCIAVIPARKNRKEARE